jgi:hypothetical protein
VALLWSGSSVLVQYVYSDLTFDSPFFVTYLSNILFSLYLPGWAAASRLGMVQQLPWRRSGESLRGLLCGWLCGGGKGGRTRLYAPIQREGQEYTSGGEHGAVAG